MRRSCLLALLACLGVVAAGTVALAHVQKTDTKTTLQSPDGNIDTEEGSYFKGKVTSGKAACVGNRTVRWKYSDFFYAPKGGTVKTDSNGNWRVDEEHAGSGYEFQVLVKAKQLLKNGQHTHTCREVKKTEAP